MNDRTLMTPLVSQVRAYFAPAETAFDPAAAFDLDFPPAPWLDLGWIEGLTRTAATRIVPLRAGSRGAVTRSVRAELGARVDFDFRSWGKFQMALSGGSQHFNVLTGSAVAIASGTATQLNVGAGVSSFAAGDLVAVDIDYAAQTGNVGSGIPGAYVANAAQIGNDPDFIRRVTFNVARIASISGNDLVLDAPLIAGLPANAQVQKLIGFTDREGGSFWQEWAALFVLPSDSGARIIFHYPRLQPAAPAAELPFDTGAPRSALSLHAGFLALPITDSTDGEQIVCYRHYLPAPNSPVR